MATDGDRTRIFTNYHEFALPQIPLVKIREIRVFPSVFIRVHPWLNCMVPGSKLQPPFICSLVLVILPA